MTNIMVPGLLLLLAVATPALGQSQGWALEDRDYFNPLSAEPRSARMVIEVPGRSDRFEFSRTPQEKHWVWEITMGREFPLVGRERQDRGESPATRQAGDWGWGLWLPVSFHMIEYMDGDSNPIVNNDYRFGALFKFSRTIRNGVDLHARVGAGHESTHLGDEFTIFAERAHPTTFERINVSWEYWEVAGGLETDRVSIRGGYIDVFGKDGFYGGELLEPVEPPRQIPISKRNYEPWIGGEFRSRLPADWTYQWFASADVRFRTVYDYHRASAEVGEDVQPSLNLLVGLRSPRVDSGARILREIYFRFYEGVNPHGQFRNDPNYTYFATGVRFGFDF